MTTLTDTTAPSAVLAVNPRRRSRPPLGWGVHDSLAMIGRSLRRSLREPDALFLSVLLPVVLMVLFTYVFGGAIDTGGQYIDFVVPGIILLCSGFGAGTTAVSVASDMTEGLMNRLRSLPMRPTSVLTGHAVASLARNTVSTAIVIGAALALGFRPTAGAAQWGATIGLILLWILAITWVSVCMGLLARSVEAANGATMVFMFLPYVSSAFVPPETMPRVLELFARYQPITPITDTLREWLLGPPFTGQPWVAVAWCLGIALVARLAAQVLLTRRHAA